MGDVCGGVQLVVFELGRTRKPSEFTSVSVDHARRNPLRKTRSRRVSPVPARKSAKAVRTLAKAQARAPGAWAKALPEPPAISLPLHPGNAAPTSAKAPQPPARMSESAPEKAQPKSAKAALKVSGN